MTLRSLLRDVKVVDIQGNIDLEIGQIRFDSRLVKAGDVFVAIKGSQADGHQFIDKAVEKGAVAIIAEAFDRPCGTATMVSVAQSTAALGWMACNFYERPSGKLKLVGVTGTNGKTTTVSLLYGLFTSLGYKAGLLSTIENKIGNQVLPSTHTTPDPLTINAMIQQMVEEGCQYAFMEVSSHAIDQHRITGLEFAGAVFTNITHDHLDYHKTFQNYILTKKRFFDDLPKGAFALVNIDDKRGEVMVQNTAATISTYSLHRMAEFKAKILENGLAGLHLVFDGQEFHSRLIGEFNAYNLLAVFAVSRLLQVEKTEALASLSELRPAEGRFDYFIEPTRQISCIVDYAHTPDALEKVLMTIRQLKNERSRIIVVTGCGGDRDRTKRPLMAKIACELSDLLILTSDNPRSENPEDIIAEMQLGLQTEDMSKVLSITDRLQAIKTAVKLAQVSDIILVAGKGHEKYQDIKGVKYPFDDKEALRKAF